MPQHREERLLPYPAPALFGLVLDVRSYPAFLPWCQATRVYQETEGRFVADVMIGYKVLRERYTCEVHHRTPEEIRVVYRSGPFQRLHNEWRFVMLDDATTRIEFFIDFEFRSKLLQRVAGALFHDVVRRMVGAFEQRAHSLYGGVAEVFSSPAP